MATLVAKSHIKFGSKVIEGYGQGRPTRTVAGKRVAPGETFEVDTEMAKQFLESGVAITTAEARAEQRERISTEERLRAAEEEEKEEEAREAGLEAGSASRRALGGRKGDTA